LSFIFPINSIILILNNRFATKESACKAICHLHGTKIQGRTIRCSWGRDDSINDRYNITNYGNGNMNNQKNNNNNQYHSVCLNKKNKINLSFPILLI